MGFLREKDYEPLLVLETRELTSQEGKRYSFTMFELHWQAFDAMINRNDFSAEYLIENAELWAHPCGEDVEVLFPDRVWAWHDWLHNKVGVNTGVPVAPRPIILASRNHKS